jgi:ankyrin repeat protein
VQRDAVLSWLMQSMPPAGFTSLRRRYLNQQRAAHQEMMNVHDPIFAGLRQETAHWLSALHSSVSDSYQLSNLEEYKQHVKRVFNDIKGNFLESLYSHVQKKKDAAEKDFILYLDHIFEKYESGATGLEHLVYALQWAQATQETQDKQQKAREERYIIVFNALNEARTAYEQDQNKYEEGHDWSCMPGLDERILDTMGMIKRSLEPEIPLKQQPSYKQYATHATDEFLSADGQPSSLFNSLCMRALMPAYKTETIFISGYELTQDQQLIEAARAVYLEDQKLAVQAAQDSYIQWCQGQETLASLPPSLERTDLRRQQAWLYSAFQEFLDIKTEEDGSQTIKGLYEEQALQDLLIKKFNTKISNPATIKEQPWAQGLVIETTRSLAVVADQPVIFESAFDANYAFKMSDEEFMELIAQNTGITLDHVQLLTALMAGGKGLSWFKESLLADKPIPCLAVAALETKLNEIKSDLLALSLRQIKRDPFAYFRHLVDDRGLIEAVAAIINHQGMNHLTLPCQDTLLANVADQVTDRNRRNHLATLCVEHGFSITLRILLSEDPKVDVNYIDQSRSRLSLLETAISNGHIQIVNILLDASVNINALNDDGCTPLWIASNGHVEIVKALLKASESKGTDHVNIADKYGNTPLFRAAIDGCTEIARTLIAVGAGINIVNKYGFSPLFFAASGGHRDVVSLLIEAGADINIENKDRDTPIFQAVYLGDRDVVSVLLEAGAAINIENKDGETPLFQAVYRGNRDVVSLLLEAGADLNIINKDGKTPLLYATEYGNEEIITLLKEEVYSQRKLRTSLHALTKMNEEEICRGLNRLHTIDLSNTDNGDQQLFFRMAKIGAIKAFDLLIKRSGTSLSKAVLKLLGGDINRLDQDGHTVLYHAVKEGQVEMVKHILNQYKPNLTIKDNDYQTLLDLAGKLIQWELMTYKSNNPTLFATAVLLFSKGINNTDKDKPNHRY